MEKPFVLLADDNEATRTLIAALLHGDFDVDIATDGAEAIEKLKSRQYAAILLDLLMPVVDGFEVLAFLRAQRPLDLQRVIVVTAALSSRQQERVREFEICAIVAKPFDVDDLSQAVKNCAGPRDNGVGIGPLLSGGMLFLIADLLRRVP